MAKKVKVKKKKLNFKKVFMVLLLLYLLIYVVYSALNSPIQNIYIYDNKVLTDQEVIELADLQDYPSLLSTTSLSLNRKLEKNPFIDSVKIKKKLFNQIHIYVDEHRLLCYKRTEKEVLLDNGKWIKLEKNEYNIPNLINAIPEEYHKTFVSKFSRLSSEIISKISEVEYKPNDIDKERFLFSMNDGNYVYITLKKIIKLNEYDKIMPYTEGKKGVFYLDSGDYFKIL